MMKNDNEFSEHELFDGSIEQLRRRFASGRRAMMSLATVAHMLEKFISGKIDSRYLCEWAEIFDVNEFVEFKAGEEQMAIALLFELSSPEINSKIDAALAASMINRIERR